MLKFQLHVHNNIAFLTHIDNLSVIVQLFFIQVTQYIFRPSHQVQGHWILSWWRHQMDTFSALLAICAGNSPVPGEFPTQRPVTQSFDVFFDLRLNKRLSKQSWGWWFETLSRPLWRHVMWYNLFKWLLCKGIQLFKFENMYNILYIDIIYVVYKTSCLNGDRHGHETRK